MRVAALQHDIVWEDAPATLASLDVHVDRAVGAGAGLVVLTEMFATGFSMQTDRTAQGEDGPIVEWMSSRASMHGVRVAGSVAIRDGDEVVNRLLVVGPDGVESRYDKLHPFSYSGEHERFAAGHGLVTATVDGVRFGLTVCYDLRFANLYWKMGPDVDAFLVVANWPAARRAHWTRLLRARAIENQAWVVGVNRVGTGGRLGYAGDSQIIHPSGELVASAADQEVLLVADVDAAEVARVRDEFPFMADRREV